MFPSEVNFNQLLPHIQIKQQLIREASALHRDLEFSIQDDVTNYVISGIAVKTKNLKLASGEKTPLNDWLNLNDPIDFSRLVQ